MICFQLAQVTVEVLTFSNRRQQAAGLRVAAFPGVCSDVINCAFITFAGSALKVPSM